MLLGFSAARAAAQVAVSAQLESDDRFRGVSLSAGEPALSVTVAYDHSTGLYGGLTGVLAATRHSGVQPLGYVAYLGYAGRLGGDASWDVGVSNSEDVVYLNKRDTQNYTEVYAGVSKGDLSAHVY